MGGGGKGTTGGAASDAAMAVNVLRGVLRACPLEVLQQLLAAGVDRGIGAQEQRRALVQAAHGDAGLMEKVRRLIGSG